MEGNFDIDAGDGDGGGPFRIQTPPKTQTSQTNRTEIVHTSGNFSKRIKNMLKNIFNISSYIQKNTKNPINALKITIYNTNHTYNTNIHSKKSKLFKQI